MSVPRHHNWKGKRASFYKTPWEGEGCPIRPIEEAKGNVLIGTIIDQKTTDLVGQIPTYLCKVQGDRGGIKIINSTTQYLQIIE